MKLKVALCLGLCNQLLQKLFFICLFLVIIIWFIQKEAVVYIGNNLLNVSN